MNEIFSGLLLYELVLLLLGVILFLILCVGLLFYIIKKEQIKKLLLFFAIPILMIGYPSIKEVSISKDRIALTKYQERFIENPNDTVAKQMVEEYTEKLKDRAASTEDIVQISKSNLLLGKNKEAVEFADKALTREDSNEKAQDIKKLVTVQKAIESAGIENQDSVKIDSIVRQIPVVEDFNKLKPFLMKKAGDRLRNLNN